MRKTSLFALFALFAMAIPATAQAGEPVEFSERPLTYHEGTLALDAGLAIVGLDNGLVDLSTTALAVGATYAFTDDLQLNAVVLPLLLDPEVDYGNPSITARYRFLKSAVELGAEVGVTIPVQDSTDLSLDAGLRGLLGLTDNTSLWFGLMFNIVMADETVTNMAIPVQFRMNLAPSFFWYAGSGLSVADMDFDTLTLPLGVGIGYTLAGPTGDAMLDIYAGYAFPGFLYLGGAEGVDTVNTDHYAFTVGATFFAL
ncbi:MAG: hypothetical protein CSA66_00235 [Proteobacteria bacterium]|nr:MAG: hypothetical protein CSA66_00235 [Pseudomonadota bacterium]